MPNGLKRPGRDTTKSGLEPDDAAEAGRHADRPAAVGADVESTHAERRRHGRPAARPAGGTPRVPRVARNLAQRVVGHGLPAELGRRGLAEKHGTLLAQPGDRGCILGLGSGLAGREAAAPRRPSLGQDQILHRRGHAVDEPPGLALLPAGFRGARRRQRVLLVDKAEGVDLRIVPRDALEAGLRHLDRRGGLPAVEPEQLGRRKPRKVRRAHRRSPRSSNVVVLGALHAPASLSILSLPPEGRWASRRRVRWTRMFST